MGTLAFFLDKKMCKYFSECYFFMKNFSGDQLYQKQYKRLAKFCPQNIIATNQFET